MYKANVGRELTRIFQYVLTSAFPGAEWHSRCLTAAHHYSSGASSFAAAAEPPVDFTEALAHLPCQGMTSPFWLSVHLLFL